MSKEDPGTPSSDESGIGRVVLVSWNVASWPTTLKLIKEHYGSLGQYLDRHGVDILCLQETKINRERVEDHPISGCNEGGWSSFWSCCNTASTSGAASKGKPSTASKRGFNGVATFARTGLVKSACCDIFENDDLDNEGRCVVTELSAGGTLIFNVYVPTSGDRYRRMPFKMRFLRELRRRMAEARQRGRSVILVGDLNIAPGDADVHWRHKVVNLAELEALSRGQAVSAPVGADSAPQTVLKVATKVGSLVTTIREKLRAIEIVRIPGKQGQTEQFNRYARREESYKAVVYNHSRQEGAKDRQTQDLSAPKEVKIGKTFHAEWSARLRLGCKEYSVEDEVTGENHLCWRGDLSVQHLSDTLKAASVTLSEEELRILSRHYGRTYYAPCLIDYFDLLTRGDDMVDTFRHGYPSTQVEERFTCWEQYTNARYENKGVRIDFILIDKDLFESSHSVADYGLDGGCDKFAIGSERAALRECTANGQFKMAPFNGGGMEDPPQWVYDKQFKRPHNGILYFPPRYSDHVGVSFVMHLKNSHVGKENGARYFTEKRTLRSQPHQSTRKIHTFFQGNQGAKPKKRPANIGISTGISLGGSGAECLGPKSLGPKAGTKVKATTRSSKAQGKKQKTMLSFLNR